MSDPVLIDQLHGRWRYGFLLAGLWLAYLSEPLIAAWNQPNRGWGAVGIAATLAFAVLYLEVWSKPRRYRGVGPVTSPGWRCSRLAVASFLVVVMCRATGAHGLAAAPFLVVLTMLLLPVRVAIGVLALLFALVFAAAELLPGWGLDSGLVASLLFSAMVMWALSQVIQRNAALRQQAELAVAQERARFARDLHDLLGHSLTLLAMKAELAGRLLRLDPERAEAEIADVERLARDALVDVRGAVGGYRGASLAGELVAARAALDAAGIEAELPAAVDDVPGERRELFGWVVREGVTNVVRHSAARRCRVVIDREAVEIVDDGRGPAADQAAHPGHGLEGLRERAETVGARLSVGRSAEGGFRLRVGW